MFFINNLVLALAIDSLTDEVKPVKNRISDYDWFKKDVNLCVCTQKQLDNRILIDETGELEYMEAVLDKEDKNVHSGQSIYLNQNKYRKPEVETSDLLVDPGRIIDMPELMDRMQTYSNAGMNYASPVNYFDGYDVNIEESNLNWSVIEIEKFDETTRLVTTVESTEKGIESTEMDIVKTAKINIVKTAEENFVKLDSVQRRKPKNLHRKTNLRRRRRRDLRNHMAPRESETSLEGLESKTTVVGIYTVDKEGHENVTTNPDSKRIDKYGIVWLGGIPHCPCNDEDLEAKAAMSKAKKDVYNRAAKLVHASVKNAIISKSNLNEDAPISFRTGLIDGTSASSTELPTWTLN